MICLLFGGGSSFLAICLCSCGSGDRAGHLVVRSLATPVCMSIYPEGKMLDPKLPLMPSLEWQCMKVCVTGLMSVHLLFNP